MVQKQVRRKRLSTTEIYATVAPGAGEGSLRDAGVRAVG
jgi:hypothetical protein